MRPARFCFLLTARETRVSPTPSEQQGLFCANKCGVLIAGTPFQAASDGRWLIAVQSKLAVCHKQVLTVAGVAFSLHTTRVLQHMQRVALLFPALWLPWKGLGMSHSNQGFPGSMRKNIQLRKRSWAFAKKSWLE